PCRTPAARGLQYAFRSLRTGYPCSRPRGDDAIARGVSLRRRLFQGRSGARFLEAGDLVGRVAELAQHLLVVLAQERRAFHIGRRGRQLDRVADRQVLAARGVVDLDHRAGGAQGGVLGQLLHGQDRAHRDVDGVADLHDLELGLRHRPLLDAAEDLVEARQTRGRLGVVGMRLPAGLADHVADRLPYRRLGDEIDVGVGVLFPALALQDAPRLAATGIVAGARHGLAERDALAVLAVFRQRS